MVSTLKMKDKTSAAARITIYLERSGLLRLERFGLLRLERSRLLRLERPDYYVITYEIAIIRKSNKN